MDKRAFVGICSSSAIAALIAFGAMQAADKWPLLIQFVGMNVFFFLSVVAGFVGHSFVRDLQTLPQCDSEQL